MRMSRLLAATTGMLVLKPNFGTLSAISAMVGEENIELVRILY
ncbi:hypothetical protein PA3_33000 [Acinetobacter pittii]|uniref:Uncharacterized protein n=1 Tax=Acinetobacter pittii TaxID=48296 RepID=A0A4Y3JCQ4_ACIPI|nr:hypothetical protein [Acinetobacter pittii]GEA69142.1 hypothetical protein PA3_33000 [Acinetobacter pittii]